MDIMGGFGYYTRPNTAFTLQRASEGLQKGGMGALVSRWESLMILKEERYTRPFFQHWHQTSKNRPTSLSEPQPRGPRMQSLPSLLSLPPVSPRSASVSQTLYSDAYNSILGDKAPVMNVNPPRERP